LKGKILVYNAYSGLAPSYSPGVGYDTTTKEATFNFGVSNIVPSKENLAEVQKTIESTMKQIHDEGISEEKLESQLHTIELAVKRTRNNWGLGVISNMLPHTLHEGDPLSVFTITEYINRLRKDYKEGIFSKLIKKHLLTNPHKVVMHFIPDPTLTEKNQLREKILLDSISKGLSASDKERLIKEAEALKKDQELIQDPSQLPGLTIEDIPSTIEFVDFNQSKIGEAPVYWFEQPTNGITHVRVKLNVQNIPPHLRELLPVFCNFISEIGTKNYDYKKFHTLMQSTTEGLNASADSFSLSADLDDSRQTVVLSVCFLDKNADKAMTYLSEILATPNFDDSSHLSDLIKASSVDIANGIGDKSLQYGLSLASSGLKKYARDYDTLKSDLFFCELGAKTLSTSILTRNQRRKYFIRRHRR
jgi:Zn-dependent M16 (insulinase) family peptidase